MLKWTLIIYNPDKNFYIFITQTSNYYNISKVNYVKQREFDTKS